MFALVPLNPVTVTDEGVETTVYDVGVAPIVGAVHVTVIIPVPVAPAVAVPIVGSPGTATLVAPPEKLPRFPLSTLLIDIMKSPNRMH
jgi:hypothetical protein